MAFSFLLFTPCCTSATAGVHGERGRRLRRRRRGRVDAAAAPERAFFFAPKNFEKNSRQTQRTTLTSTFAEDEEARQQRHDGSGRRRPPYLDGMDMSCQWRGVKRTTPPGAAG